MKLGPSNITQSFAGGVREVTVACNVLCRASSRAVITVSWRLHNTNIMHLSFGGSLWLILCFYVTKNIAWRSDPFNRHCCTHLIRELAFEMLQVPADLSRSFTWLSQVGFLEHSFLKNVFKWFSFWDIEYCLCSLTAKLKEILLVHQHTPLLSPVYFLRLVLSVCCLELNIISRFLLILSFWFR